MIWSLPIFAAAVVIYLALQWVNRKPDWDRMEHDYYKDNIEKMNGRAK